jgi:trimethylamine---corrinoid protein Co-methyltransferase
MTALAGANVIYGLGMIESGITFDYGQLVMDNEFAAMIKHAVNGIAVNDETLAVDVIDEVGPFKDFMGHQSTYDYMRSQSQPRLIDRRVRDDWAAMGGISIYEKAWETARDLLANYDPPALPEDVCGELRNIVNATEKELGVPLSEA